MTSKRKKNAFSLVELTIVLIILSIILGLATPEILETIKESKAQRCGTAMRIIEGAKAQWRKDYPDWADIWEQQNRPTQADLERYIPGGVFPDDPWGVGFTNPLNPGAVTSHPYNGLPQYEPRGNNSTENGYNDIYQLQR